MTGRATDQATRDRINHIRDQLNGHVERVRADRGLSDEGKRRQIAGYYLEWRKELDDLRASAERSKVERRAKLERDLFSIEAVIGPYADAATRASAAVSQRDAQDRVTAALKEAGHDPRAIHGTLTELLERADRSGDEFMARAVAEAGLRHRQADVLNAFSASRPLHEEKVDALWEQEATGLRDVLATEFTYTLDVPQEVAGRTPQEIERVAAGEGAPIALSIGGTV